jgi:lipopolysaccharide transport system permease protein
MQPELTALARVPGSFFARNLVTRRSLLVQLVRRDFEQRFVGSAGGWLWGLIHPLVLLASWTFVFQFCLKVQIEPQQNYTLFLFSGFVPWLLFQDTVQRSATCVVENAGLIKKTVFPVEFIPTSILLSSLIHHLISVVLAIIAVAIVLERWTFVLAVLPLYAALLGLFSLGVGWIVSGLEVYVRDTKQILSVVLTFWFWLTPILVAEQQVPARFRFLLMINPLAYTVRAYREILLWGRVPALTESVILGMYALLAFACGGVFFRHLKRGFADVL